MYDPQKFHLIETKKGAEPKSLDTATSSALVTNNKIEWHDDPPDFDDQEFGT